MNNWHMRDSVGRKKNGEWCFYIDWCAVAPGALSAKVNLAAKRAQMAMCCDYLNREELGPYRKVSVLFASP